VGFGVPTRVFNGPGLDDPQSIVSIGFVAATPADAREWLAAGPRTEQVRHDRIDAVVESTSLRAMYEVRTEHDFTGQPRQLALGAPGSLLAGLG
jgi:hypothetical protein